MSWEGKLPRKMSAILSELRRLSFSLSWLLHYSASSAQCGGLELADKLYFPPGSFFFCLNYTFFHAKAFKAIKK